MAVIDRIKRRILNGFPKKGTTDKCSLAGTNQDCTCCHSRTIKILLIDLLTTSFVNNGQCLKLTIEDENGFIVYVSDLCIQLHKSIFIDISNWRSGLYSVALEEKYEKYRPTLLFLPLHQKELLLF